MLLLKSLVYLPWLKDIKIQHIKPITRGQTAGYTIEIWKVYSIIYYMGIKKIIKV